IRRARRSVAGRQLDLAAAAGLSRAAVGLIEAGSRSVRRETARKLAGGLRVLGAERTADGREALGRLERVLANRWARIRSVKAIEPPSRYVYDLSVPGSETFLAGFGGLIVHNT